MRSSENECKMISDPSGFDGFNAAFGSEPSLTNRKKRKRNKNKNKYKKQQQIVTEGLDQVTAIRINKGKQVGTGQRSEMVSMGAESYLGKNNSVLRKLLRRARYFDPPKESSCSCRNCSKEDHRERNCTAQKRRRPCFVCGTSDHSWKRCKLRRNCFACKGQGHLAKDCPDKNQGDNPSSNICLRCGIDSGHDMFSCCNNYCLDDIKEIQCYICKSFGHLCCVDPLYASPISVSCYNCGQSGHLGSECARACEYKRDFSCQHCATSAGKIDLQENSQIT